MSSVGIKQQHRSKVSAPITSLSNVFGQQKGKSGRNFPRLLSTSQKLQLKDGCSEDENKNCIHNSLCALNNGKHSTESYKKTPAPRISVFEMKNISDKDSLSENNVASKHVHPPVENVHRISNSTYVFIDNKAVSSYKDIMVNNTKDNSKQTGADVKQLENLKILKKTPPLPPLPLALICKNNKNMILKTDTSSTETSCSNSYLQCVTTGNIAIIETPSLDGHKNSSDTINQSNNKNVRKLLSKTNKQTSRPWKRPAPKPPVMPSGNHLPQPNDYYGNASSFEKHNEKQTSNQTEEPKIYEYHSEANKEDKAIHCVCLANGDAEKCPSLSTSLDSPPELPSKTVPHDTKVLFGYSIEEQASASKFHDTTEHGCNSLETQDNNISVKRALPQLTLPVGCKIALPIGNSTTNNQITSRVMFYKSLSLRRYKKPSPKNIGEETQLKTCVDEQNHHFPVLRSDVENIAGLFTCSKSSHNVVEIKAGDMALSVDPPNIMEGSLTNNTNDVSQDIRSYLLKQSSKTTSLHENMSAPFVSGKYNPKNSSKISHLENKFSKERTNQNSTVSEILSCSTLPTLSQITSNLKQDESPDCTESITSTEDKVLNEMGNKHDIIKETENISTYKCATDIFSQRITSDLPSVLERMDKNNSDTKRTASDSIKPEIKCSPIDNKQHVSETAHHSTFMKVVEDGKKETGQYLNDMSGKAFQTSACCNDLKCTTTQVNFKEAGIEQRNLSKNNITVMETCHELHNTTFAECHNDAKVIPPLLENHEKKISSFQRPNNNKLPLQQNTSDVANSSNAVSIEKGLHVEKKKLATGAKLFQNEFHPFSSESGSSHISNKLGVNSQNRYNNFCPLAKSTKPLPETSTVTIRQQTSTTSEVSTLCKLGPSKIYNQAIFLPAGTMSSQQLNITVLFRQLEAAIANGNHKKAALLARELAMHKVACSLSSFNIHEQSAEEKPITVNLYIEDKNLHQGPFPLLVHCSMTLGALKSKLEKEFALPKNLQRWILGKRLATDDNTILQDYGVTETGCSVFLYLICSDSSESQNNLFEKLSKIPKNVSSVQKFHNLDHSWNNDAHSREEITSDVENITEANNISEDEYVSDGEDSYLSNSGLSPSSAIDDNSEADESENQRHASAGHSVSDYEETEVDSDHSSSSDFVMITDNFLEEEEKDILDNEQSVDELDINHINIDETNTNNEVIHWIEENVHNHTNLIESPSAISPDRVTNREKETENFSNASHIPNINENNHIFDDENTLHNYNSHVERDNKESEIYFIASSEYISPTNDEPSSVHDDLLNPETTVDSPFDTKQQWTELVKCGEIKEEELFGHHPLEKENIAIKNEFGSKVGSVEDLKGKDKVKFASNANYIMLSAKQKMEDLHYSEQLYTENSHIQQSEACVVDAKEKLEQNAAEKQEVKIQQKQYRYLPDMEFVAVINEFDIETEKGQKGNQVETCHFVNYVIPTTIELTEQKLEDIHNAQAIEIWVPEISVVHTTEKRLDQSDTVACISCGSLHALLDDKCESCELKTDAENAVDKANTHRTVDPTMVEESSDDKNITNYQYLMQLDNQDLIPNAEPFWCPVCFTDIPERQGVVLRDCLHQFCKECLAGSVEHAETTIIKCPFRNEEYSCESYLQEREIKAVVTAEIFERYLHRGMMVAEGRADNSFHCKMPDCLGWCILDDSAGTFQCPTCTRINCLKCQAVHEGLTCQQYQEELEYQLARNEEVQETKNYLENMVKDGKAMLCPKCDAFVIKRWGCDWLKCSVCQTEICWVTKKARWGPGGHGDTSDGCKCGVNGQRCHPKCNYCH